MEEREEREEREEKNVKHVAFATVFNLSIKYNISKIFV